jgi:hypothetical protein
MYTQPGDGVNREIEHDIRADPSTQVSGSLVEVPGESGLCGDGVDREIEFTEFEDAVAAHRKGKNSSIEWECRHQDLLKSSSQCATYTMAKHSLLLNFQTMNWA